MTSLLQSAQGVKRHSPIPLYRQIADLILQTIRAGRISPGERLPSEFDVADQYHVSRVTVRKAFQELERMGCIYREQGKGTFAARPAIQGISGFGSFTAEVTSQGRRASSKVLDFRHVDSLPSQMKERLQVPEEAVASVPFVLLRRLRLIDEEPVAIEDAYLPQALYPGIESMDYENRSLYDTIAQRWGIVPVWADALIESVVAAPAEADLLGVPTGAPLLVAWRITLTETDEVVEYVKSVYNGSKFIFNVGRHRIA